MGSLSLGLEKGPYGSQVGRGVSLTISTYRSLPLLLYGSSHQNIWIMGHMGLLSMGLLPYGPFPGVGTCVGEV